MKPKFMSVKEFILAQFYPNCRPDKRTIYKMIDSGEIKGRRFGDKYYVEIDKNGHAIECNLISEFG
jgi:hypothetical protein